MEVRGVVPLYLTCRNPKLLTSFSFFFREKFVQFEAYAEKLSTEAVDLRNKISKEQRESRRLTSLVTMTAQEKLKLQIRMYCFPLKIPIDIGPIC